MYSRYATDINRKENVEYGPEMRKLFLSILRHAHSDAFGLVLSLEPTNAGQVGGHRVLDEHHISNQLGISGIEEDLILVTAKVIVMHVGLSGTTSQESDKTELNHLSLLFVPSPELWIVRRVCHERLRGRDPIHFGVVVKVVTAEFTVWAVLEITENDAEDRATGDKCSPHRDLLLIVASKISLPIVQMTSRGQTAQYWFGLSKSGVLVRTLKSQHAGSGRLTITPSDSRT